MTFTKSKAKTQNTEMLSEISRGKKPARSGAGKKPTPTMMALSAFILESRQRSLSVMKIVGSIERDPRSVRTACRELVKYGIAEFKDDILTVEDSELDEADRLDALLEVEGWEGEFEIEEAPAAEADQMSLFSAEELSGIETERTRQEYENVKQAAYCLTRPAKERPEEENNLCANFAQTLRKGCTKVEQKLNKDSEPAPETTPEPTSSRLKEAMERLGRTFDALPKIRLPTPEDDSDITRTRTHASQRRNQEINLNQSRNNQYGNVELKELLVVARRNKEAQWDANAYELTKEELLQIAPDTAPRIIDQIAAMRGWGGLTEAEYQEIIYPIKFKTMKFRKGAGAYLNYKITPMLKKRRWKRDWKEG